MFLYWLTEYSYYCTVYNNGPIKFHHPYEGLSPIYQTFYNYSAYITNSTYIREIINQNQIFLIFINTLISSNPDTNIHTK